MKRHFPRRSMFSPCQLLLTILGGCTSLVSIGYSSEHADIILAKETTLVYLDMTTHESWDLFTSNSPPFSIDYYEQPEGYSLFWSDLSRNAVYSGQLKNKTLINPKTIIKDRVGSVETIAVDWVAQHLYWVTNDLGQIEVSHFDGSYRAPVVVDIIQPRALALDPISGWMFWSDLNDNSPCIEKSTMAGKQRRTLIKIDAEKGNGWLNAIVLDHVHQQLYWVDAKSDSIHSISYDGTGYQEIVRGHQLIQQPYSITLLDDSIIWSDVKYKSVVKMNPNSTDATKILYQTDGRIFGITVLHPSRKPEGKNPCVLNNGGCSHLCLIDGLRFKCHCPTLMRLLSDNRTCEVDDTILLITHTDTNQKKKTEDIITISSLVFNTSDSPLISFPMQKIDNISSIEYDALQNRLWFASHLKGLSLMNLNNSSSEHQFGKSLSPSDSISWNWLTNEIYFLINDTDSGIFRCSLQRELCQKVITGLNSPGSLTVLPIYGIMFWMNEKNGSRIIEGSSLNGTHRTTIATGNQLFCLTSDLNGNLYWIDWHDKTVKRMRPNFNIQTIWNFPVEIERPISMGVIDNLLICGMSEGTLYVINLTSNITMHFTVPNVGNILQIKVVNVTQQKDIVEHCLQNSSSCPGSCLAEQANQMICRTWDSEIPRNKTVPSTIKSSSLRNSFLEKQINISKTREMSCNLTCLNNGKCVFTASGDQLCWCPAMYWGEKCEKSLCPCINGECKISGQKWTCICHKGFSGQFCENLICSEFCLNGNCSDKSGFPRCICKDGWSGPDCSIHSSEIVSMDSCVDYCLNGGSCLSKADDKTTLKCMCPNNFTGLRCQFPQENGVDVSINSLQSIEVAILFFIVIILSLISSCIYAKYKRLKKSSKVLQHKDYVAASDSSLMLTVTNNCTFETDTSCLRRMKEFLNGKRKRCHTFNLDTQPLQELVVFFSLLDFGVNLNKICTKIMKLFANKSKRYRCLLSG